MTDFTSLLALADQCVKCGLCLPQCPTYTLSLNENESPRGRISLIQALANGQLDANQALLTHLDHCLQCRRCERVCPSQVRYGEILATAYQQLPVLKKHTSHFAKLGFYFLQTSQRLQLLRTLLRFYQSSGLQFIARASGLLNFLKLKHIEQRLPKATGKFKNVAINSQYSKQVVLFTGCSQSMFDSKAIDSTVKLLNALEIDVVIPEQQNCCGALHKLQGEDASALVKNNLHIFGKSGVNTILYLSTGCGAFIKDQYDSSVNFQEITDFLTSENLGQLTFKPLKKKIAVHIPCTQKNVLQQSDCSSALLKNIAGIELVSLEQQGCCGAGGTTMLKYPEMADEIRQPLLDKITQANCELTVTTNPGCQLHLQDGFNTQDSAVNVLHPVTLLAQQLEG